MAKRKQRTLRDQIILAMMGEMPRGITYDRDIMEAVGRNQIRITKGSKSILITIEKEAA